MDRHERGKIREKAENNIKGIISKIMRKIREKEYEERRMKINESGYNRDYGKVMIGRPKYLKRERKWKNIRLIARLR